VKVSFYLALRPVTHRYDRLLADLATLTRMLAERLADAEAEIAQLRERLAGVDDTTGPSERATPSRRTRKPSGEG
jgi:ABC-type transporter Mla subunit MlaD